VRLQINVFSLVRLKSGRRHGYSGRSDILSPGWRNVSPQKVKRWPQSSGLRGAGASAIDCWSLVRAGGQSSGRIHFPASAGVGQGVVPSKNSVGLDAAGPMSLCQECSRRLQLQAGGPWGNVPTELCDVNRIAPAWDGDIHVGASLRVGGGVLLHVLTVIDFGACNHRIGCTSAAA
jgi:hypothetical protein